MDTVYMYFDISVLAVSLVAVGFVVGWLFLRKAFAVMFLISTMLGLYSVRTIFGAPVDQTTAAAYMASFFFAGAGLGGAVRDVVERIRAVEQIALSLVREVQALRAREER